MDQHYSRFDPFPVIQEGPLEQPSLAVPHVLHEGLDTAHLRVKARQLLRILLDVIGCKTPYAKRV